MEPSLIGHKNKLDAPVDLNAARGHEPCRGVSMALVNQMGVLPPLSQLNIFDEAVAIEGPSKTCRSDASMSLARR